MKRKSSNERVYYAQHLGYSNYALQYINVTFVDDTGKRSIDHPRRPVRCAATHVYNGYGPAAEQVNPAPVSSYCPADKHISCTMVLP